MSGENLTQVIIFVVEEVGLKNAWSVNLRRSSRIGSSILAGYALLPRAFLDEHPEVEELFAQNSIKIIKDIEANPFRHCESTDIRLEVVEMLLLESRLPRGPPHPNKKPPDHQVNLSLLCSMPHNGLRQTMNLLFSKNMSVSYKPDFQLRKIIILPAVDEKNFKILDDLLTRGFDINFRPFRGGGLLHTFAAGPETLIDLVLKRDSSLHVDDRRDDGATPLFIAVLSGHLSAVDALLKKGAGVNVASSDGETPLHFAVFCGHTQLIELLLKHGANANVKTLSMQETPLCYAVAKNRGDIVKTLLIFGAKINLKDAQSRTVLYSAAKFCHLDLVQLFLENGADVNCKTWEQRSALFAAVEENNEKITEILIKYGAKVNQKDKKGLTPLHLAARLNNFKLVDLLLRNGADANALSITSVPPIFEAVKYHHNLEIIEALKMFGANVHHRDDLDHSILDMARPRYYYPDKCPEVFNFILESCYFELDPVRMALEDLHDQYKISPCEYMRFLGRTVVHHFVKLDSLINSVLIIFDSKFTWCVDEESAKEYQSACKEETAQTKSDQVGNSGIFYYDLLTKSEHQIARLCENKNFVQALNLNSHEKKFLIYGKMLGYQFRKGVQRKDLMKRGMACFTRFSLLSTLPYYLKQSIIEFLSIKDILLLEKAL